MQAMVLSRLGEPLRLEQRPEPVPGPGELRLRVLACGVCRTDLHLVDGELPQARLPVVPGHQIVGIVEALGPGVDAHFAGQQVGVPWLGGACGHCRYCRGMFENLCDTPVFTGCSRDGGFATHVLARADFCLPLVGLALPPERIAPLLCAGLIGWRSLRMATDGLALGAQDEGARDIGFYGFGAAAHLVAQVALHEGRRLCAFTRPGDTAAQDFARGLGAAWAGGSDEPPPWPLDAALIFAPSGELVPLALAAVRKGGRVVCGGIHMSDLPSFPYRLMWEERQLLSVANLTRRDGQAFLAHAARHPLQVHSQAYALADANQALADLRAGRLNGAAVLLP
ncbi:zinc-dependent alcohol dehydrogenase family protein [Aquabacterium sp.]|uniref:zinc-dependent alcohol dehydrogenase family protein n=1 Tax=Aquabacterium sp. TaxID=1872578 RepID=UPI0037849832